MCLGKNAADEGRRIVLLLALGYSKQPVTGPAESLRADYVSGTHVHRNHAKIRKSASLGGYTDLCLSSTKPI